MFRQMAVFGVAVIIALAVLGLDLPNNQRSMDFSRKSALA